MEYKIVSKKTGRRQLQDTFSTVKEAEEAIVNTIHGTMIGGDKKNRQLAYGYYRDWTVKKV